MATVVDETMNLLRNNPAISSSHVKTSPTKLRAFPSFPPEISRLLARSHASKPFPFDARARIFRYRFARAAIYHGLNAIGVGPGDEVLMPAYHHGVEVQTVRSLGATVRFFPVGPDLSCSISDIKAALSPATRVIFVIHYFGFPQPIMALRELCDRRALTLFEDCSLALLSETEEGIPLGSVGELSAFCLYKSLPVPDGGLLVMNDCGALKAGRVWGLDPDILLGELRACLRSVLALPEWVVAKLLVRQVLGKRTLSDPASTPAKDRARQPPQQAGFPYFHPIQLTRTISPITLMLLTRLDFIEVRRKRRRNYEFWSRALEGNASALFPRLPAGVCPLFFPILAEDKEGLHRSLMKDGLEVHNWWAEWYEGASPGEFPDADYLRRHLLGLPVHQDLEESDMERIYAALRIKFRV